MFRRFSFRFMVMMASIILTMMALVPNAQASEPFSSTGTRSLHLSRMFTGSLVNAQGGVSRGNVYLFRNDIANSHKLFFVSKTATDENGAFSVPFPVVDSAIRSAAARNDGYVNFLGVGVNSTSKGYFGFSSRIVKGAWDHSGVKNARLLASAPLPSAQRKSLAEPDFLGPNGCLYDVKNIQDANTTVFEMHSSYDTTVTGSYGQSGNADSDIDLAVKHGDAYKIEGSVHIGNSNSNQVSIVRNANFGYGIKSEFHYVKIHIDPLALLDVGCWFVPATMKLATAWNGGDSIGSDLRYMDHHCHDTYAAYATSFVPGSNYQTGSQRAVKFKAAVTVMNVTLGADSGFSTNVGTTWKFGNQYPQYWLCGTDAKPNHASRIVAGY